MWMPEKASAFAGRAGLTNSFLPIVSRSTAAKLKLLVEEQVSRRLSILNG